MGGATGLSQEQLRALDRIAKLPQANSLHLVGGSAIAVHFSMTPALWREVRTFFVKEAPRLLQKLTRP